MFPMNRHDLSYFGLKILDHYSTICIFLKDVISSVTFNIHLMTMSRRNLKKCLLLPHE